MKYFYQAFAIVFFVLIPMLSFCTASDVPSESEALVEEIEEEFRWLREEAEAEFVTVATKTKMTAREAPSIVSVITGEDIRNMGARSIVDVLRTVPGFDLTHLEYYAGHRTTVRGLSSTKTISNDRIKTMINGHSIQIFQGDDPNIHFSTMPVGMIDRIEIIRGPGSALYGAGAFLGVINIITREGGDEPSMVSFESGSFDTVKPSAELSYKKNDFKALLYSEYYRSDGYDGAVGPDMTASFPWMAPSASREMTSDMEYYTLHTRINYKNLWFSGYLQKTDFNSPIGSLALTDENDVESDYGFAEVGIRTEPTESVNILAKVYYDRAYSNGTYELLPEETSELLGGIPAGDSLAIAPQAKWSVLGGEISANYEPHKGISLAAGTSYEHIRQYDIQMYSNHNNSDQSVEIDGTIYPPFSPFLPPAPDQPIYFLGGMRNVSEFANVNQEADRGIGAVYAEGIFDLRHLLSLESRMENLALTVGCRYDHYDDIGSSTNPRLGIVYSPTKKLWFKALHGSAFRAPDMSILHAQNTPMEENPDLKPEEIATTEGLVGYRFTKNISGSISGFYTKARDLIQVSGFKYLNIGKMESRGVEAELKAGFGKNTHAYMNATWQDVTDKTHAKIAGTDQYQGDFHPGSVPEILMNIGLNHGITENIIGHVSLNYAGKRDRSEEMIWDFGRMELVRRDKRDPVAERWLLNASLTLKSFPIKGMMLQISGFNLLDDDHRDPDTMDFILNDITRPGITYMGRIAYSF